MPGSSSKFLIATSVATSVALVSWYFMVYRKRGIVRRAAFDIGSGASKVLVADVDVSQGVVVGRPIYEIELPLAFKADAQQSKDGSLSDAITEKGLELIASLTETARKAGATEAHGVATEVFRSAPNGLAFLTAIQQRTGVAISILSQDREARLGLATAEALLGGPEFVSAAWDSGGGSFQITSRVAPNIGSSPQRGGVIVDEHVGSVALRTYVGKLGTGPSFQRLLVDVQKKVYAASATVNPTSLDEASALVALLTAELPPPPTWLHGRSVVAIGGWNCLFATTLRALRLLTDYTGGRRGGDYTGDAAGGSFSVDHARRALAAVCNQSDQALLAVAGTGTEAESASFVVPKVALLVAVASHLGLSTIRYVPATGGCQGLMALGEFAPLPDAASGAANGTGAGKKECCAPSNGYA